MRSFYIGEKVKLKSYRDEDILNGEVIDIIGLGFFRKYAVEYTYKSTYDNDGKNKLSSMVEWRTSSQIFKVHSDLKNKKFKKRKLVRKFVVGEKVKVPAFHGKQVVDGEIIDIKGVGLYKEYAVEFTYKNEEIEETESISISDIEWKYGFEIFKIHSN